MRLACRLAALATLAAASSALAGAGPERKTPPSFPDIVARVRCGIGAVGTYNPARHPSLEFLGSGFFISDKGHFVTANHVVRLVAEKKRLQDLRVFLPSDADNEGHPARLLVADQRHDLALLRVKGGQYVPLEIGDSAHVREGQAIALSGFPFGFFLGLHPSTCAGIISSISPIAVPVASGKLLDADTIAALRHPFDVFQLDAVAHPGHSGGPLFDPATGKVLGVVNSAFIRKTKEKVISTGISYAIPIHLGKAAIAKALKAKLGLHPALRPAGSDGSTP